MNYRIKLSFDAAHYLPGYPKAKGKCGQMHGHTWRVTFFVAAPEELDDSGIGTDFKVLRKALEEVLPDHELLNDHFDRPSAEHLAKWLLKRAIARLGQSCWGLELWESDGCGVDFWASEIKP